MFMSKFADYDGYVKSEALDFVDEYKQELIDNIKDGDTDVDEFIHDYRLHDWVDNDFIYVDIEDSATIINRSDNVETDSGLWENLEPEEAINSKAFFTYRNNLGFKIEELFKAELEEQVGILEEKYNNIQNDMDKAESEEDDDRYNELDEKLDKVQTAIYDFESVIQKLSR